MLLSVCGSGYYWNSDTTSCYLCPPGSTSAGSSCVSPCPANTFINVSSSTSTCSSCPSGSTSAAGSLACICADPNYYMSGSSCVPYFSANVSGSGPWGIWRAQHFNPSTGTLREARGTAGRDVTSVGTISSGSSSGAGATASVSWIGGGTTSQLSWNAVPTSTEFTICAITRYTGSSKGRILATDGTDNWLFGHNNAFRGVAHFNQWLTTSASKGTLTNWLVMCGQNGASVATPNNIIVDGKIM